MIISVILILVSFVILVKCSDIFVDNAVILARKLNISRVVVGATVISVGTTLPELLVSSFSAFEGSSQMSFGNGVGSIIFNAGIIASITMLFGNNFISEKQRDILKVPLNIFFMANILILIFIIFEWPFIRLFSLMLISLYIIYVKEIITMESDEIYEQDTNKNILIIILALIGCSFLLAISSHLLVNNAVKIARYFKLSEAVIGMTILAIGTSLPELVTAITCIRKNQNAVSFGNIIGANLIDITLVTGIPAFIRPYTLTEWGMAATSMILMCLFGYIIYNGTHKKLISVLCILTYLSFMILRTVNII